MTVGSALVMRPRRRKQKDKPSSPAQSGTRNNGTSGAPRNGEYYFTLLTSTTAQGNSANDMWNIYLGAFKDEDRRIAEEWKDGSNGILTFVSPDLLTFLFILMTCSKTGLFSVIVAAFIIEFYKKLSPGAAFQVQTVVLLGQISRQLANLPNAYSNTADEPSSEPSMIWVIGMWLISLVLNLTSALIATMLQQWARAYLETPNVPSQPNHRARVRSFLFLGTELYNMRALVQLAFSLLHLSICLFFGGLVILFHTINKKVAIAVDVVVALFGLAYITLSILPCLDLACPYRTPMSPVLWYPCHTLLSFAALGFRWLVGRFHGYLVHHNLDDTMTVKQRILFGWYYSRENNIKSHLQYITDGLGRSIVHCAINMRGKCDHNMITKLFNLLALGDESVLRKFAASIPRDRVLDLIPPIEFGRFSLREPLLILLRSCAAVTRIAGPDEEVCKRSLLVCLDAIHYIAKSINVPDLRFMWANFGDIHIMGPLLDDNDTTIRFTSRSICALLARRVVGEERLEEPQIRWLEDVTGSKMIHDANINTRLRINFWSFVYGVLSDQVGDLPMEVAMSFQETVAILLGVRTDANFRTVKSQNRLRAEVRWIQQDDPQGSREVVEKLHLVFPFLLLD